MESESGLELQDASNDPQQGLVSDDSDRSGESRHICFYGVYFPKPIDWENELRRLRSMLSD